MAVGAPECWLQAWPASPGDLTRGWRWKLDANIYKDGLKECSQLEQTLLTLSEAMWERHASVHENVLRRNLARRKGVTGGEWGQLWGIGLPASSPRTFPGFPRFHRGLTSLS